MTITDLKKFSDGYTWSPGFPEIRCFSNTIQEFSDLSFSGYAALNADDFFMVKPYLDTLHAPDNEKNPNWMQKREDVLIALQNEVNTADPQPEWERVSEEIDKAAQDADNDNEFANMLSNLTLSPRYRGSHAYSGAPINNPLPDCRWYEMLDVHYYLWDDKKGHFWQPKVRHSDKDKFMVAGMYFMPVPGKEPLLFGEGYIKNYNNEFVRLWTTGSTGEYYEHPVINPGPCSRFFDAIGYGYFFFTQLTKEMHKCFWKPPVIKHECDMSFTWRHAVNGARTPTLSQYVKINSAVKQ